jgi:hypothetical protein
MTTLEVILLVIMAMQSITHVMLTNRIRRLMEAETKDGTLVDWIGELGK